MTRLALLLLVVACVLVAWVIVGFYETPTAEPTPTTTTEVVATWPPPRTATTTSSTTTTVATTTTVRARTAPTVSTTSVWDRIAACESGGRWNDTRGGYEGGVHFLHSTWVAAGGRRYAEHAYQATRAQQIAIADAWRRRTSWAQWPLCSRRLGLR